MKKLTQLRTWFALFVAFSIVLRIQAQDNIYVPDVNFRAYLNDAFPTYMNSTGDSIIIDSAACFTGTLAPAYMNISDLTGIEAFVNVTKIDCYMNQLSRLPNLALFPDLKELACWGNLLDSLPELSGNPDLEELWCNQNNLRQLPDLTGNTKLMLLSCSDNQISTLPNLSANTALEYLNCNLNLLEVLPDLSLDTAIRSLLCADNELNNLPDLSSNSYLEVLNCSGNKLNELPDLEKNDSLISLGFGNNYLTQLPSLSHLAKLRTIFCNDNLLTELPALHPDVFLDGMNCSHNKLDFSDAALLRYIDSHTWEGFVYAPQDPFGLAQELSFTAGERMELSIAGQDSATSYQWYKDNEEIPGENDTLLVIDPVDNPDAGVYTCRSFGTALLAPPMNWLPGVESFISEPITVSISSSQLNSSIKQYDFVVYPNPGSGLFTIRVDDPEDIERLCILSSDGRKIHEVIMPHTHEIKLNLSWCESGTYLLRVEKDRSIEYRKLVVY